MKSIDFNNIRPLGSQNDGFEEFVCQLAHRMNVPAGKRFVRNGRPDGGVECYWELDNGDIWMWQAKFFNFVPGASQFSQIDVSVKTALSLHKNVKKYFIALPQDLPDDGKATTKSARKRYEEKVEQWHQIDGAEHVEFIYWGKHELLNILSRKENEGLVYFWFNREEFTEHDFESQNRKAIDALGTRYTPKLNVELDISKVFDGLARNSCFQARFQEHLARYVSAWKRIHPTEEDRRLEEYEELRGKVVEIIGDSEQFVFEGIESVPIKEFGEKIEVAAEMALAFIQRLEDIQSLQNKTKTQGDNSTYSQTIQGVRSLYFESFEFTNYLSSVECQAVNVPLILVKGEAGVGKSHLLADVVEHRRNDGQYSLLFLGQHFNTHDDPWTQIFKQLKFVGTEEQFLQALEAKAETTGKRIVIFIDALNEGGGKTLWYKYLKSFVNQIKEHPWIGLVVSIRTTYIKAIFSNDDSYGFLKLTHRGFEGKSFDAIKLFFKNSNIALPSVPLLLPEFKNPLFLKIFCEGLQKNGLTKIDEGIQGISSVFSLFIDGVERELSSPSKKDYIPDLRIVHKAVNKLIDFQVETFATEVPLDKAIELTDSVKTDRFSEGELLFELVSYGILTQNIRYRGKDKNEEVVYLSYDRFNDFLTAQRLLERADNAGDAIKSLINEEKHLWYYAGIVEFLAIIVPEKTGHELYEFLPEWRDSDYVVDSVMKSLLWRKRSTIGEHLVGYFNEVMTEQRSWTFMSILIQIGPTANHFFNAEFLHRNLMRWSMADRDHRWSTVLHYLDGDKDNAVDTLINWAREDYGQVRIDAMSKCLTAIVLGWFTTCMDRRIRDNASKGLINLVCNDVDLMINLIEKFDGVNDPYVMERIYAAAYGCALLSKKTDRLPALAKSVYAHIFDVEGEVYPDAMVRDYAKGVIEYTLSLYPDTQLGARSYLPPYMSSFLANFPSDDETKAYSKKDKNGNWITPGIDSILESMVTEHGYTVYGDFGRYVFQSTLDSWDIDPQKLSNLAVKWIMTRYGYKEKLFGVYDRAIGSGRMRQVYPGERVGKKYQWIALHEMVARLSDNVPLHDRWSDKVVTFDGTWEPYLRDFDPTMLVHHSLAAWYEPESRYWWNNQEYDAWDGNRTEWARRFDEVPDPAKVIETVDESGVHWLALQAMPDWEEPHEKEAKLYSSLWYQIRSYIVDESQYDAFKHWALNQNYTGRWMPEVSDRYEMFSREYYWSSAYRHFQKEGIISRELFDRKTKKKIADIELPCIGFLWESEYDYSKPSTVSYLKPSKQLFEGIGMCYSDKDGELVDANGRLVCFDARVNHNSHSYLLVRKDAFLQYMRANHKRILWAMIGEKNNLGSFIPHGDWLEISGLYYLDSKGDVKGRMMAYLDGKPKKKDE